MTYKTEKDIQNRLKEHLDDVLSKNDYDWFVICAQGSMNYGLMYEDSDVDSKLLTFPSLEELVLNKKPVNYVHIMENEEHCDVKDLRCYFQTFKKQNINFVEILFTPYFIVNEKYQDLWLILREHAEELAHMSEYAAIKCMVGMASEKRHALTHKYPSRLVWLEKYGYDPKQLHHLVRISFFLEDYVAGKTYSECLDSPFKDYLVKLKNGEHSLSKEEAEWYGDFILNDVKRTANKYLENLTNELDKETEQLLDSVLYEAVTRSLKGKLV